MVIFPQKLKAGDEIRIIAPARSIAVPWIAAIRQEAHDKLVNMGCKVTYGKHLEECDDFGSSSVASRIEDLHDAFKDDDVKMVLTVIGGFNSNQLLEYIDYDLLKKHPKIVCGYSDITALAHAIYAKTGIVTYSGPQFFTFGDRKGLAYTEEHFRKCLMEEKPFDLVPPKEWSDDKWARDQENRMFFPNEGYWVLNEGKASGTTVGANLCTLNLLQGTSFMPSFQDTILFIEDDHESKPHHFDRDLQSLIHLPGFAGVKGVIIGRFQRESEMTKDLLTKIVKSKKQLAHLPIVANVDFGHTYPMITFPIGGTASLVLKDGKASITILWH